MRMLRLVLLLLLHAAGSSASCNGLTNCLTLTSFSPGVYPSDETCPASDQSEPMYVLVDGECKGDGDGLFGRYELSCHRNGDIKLRFMCTDDDCAFCIYVIRVATDTQTANGICTAAELTPDILDWITVLQNGYPSLPPIMDLMVQGTCTPPPVPSVSDACTAPGSDCFEITTYDNQDEGTCAVTALRTEVLVPDDGKCYEYGGSYYQASCDDEMVTVKMCPESDCGSYYCITVAIQPTLAGSCYEYDGDNTIDVMVKGTCPPTKFPLVAVLLSAGGVLVLAVVVCYIVKKYKCK